MDFKNWLKTAKLLKTNSKDGIYAPGSLIQFFATHLDALKAYAAQGYDTHHPKHHKQGLCGCKWCWGRRATFIRKGYGLNVIKGDAVDPKLDKLEKISAYLKKISSY